jgi:heme/copper-type cytochrome/quinol oxidase subunit 2
VEHPSLASALFLVYFVVVVGFLGATVAVLARIALARIRGGAPGRFAGQEAIWTLVPVLVLVGLTMASEIPQGWQKGSHGLVGTAERAVPR